MSGDHIIVNDPPDDPGGIVAHEVDVFAGMFMRMWDHDLGFFTYDSGNISVGNIIRLRGLSTSDPKYSGREIMGFVTTIEQIMNGRSAIVSSVVFTPVAVRDPRCTAETWMPWALRRRNVGM